MATTGGGGDAKTTRQAKHEASRLESYQEYLADGND